MAQFKKGDALKVKRGEFKAKGTYVRKVDTGEGRGAGTWHEINVAAKGEPADVRRYREMNLSR